MKRVFMEGVKGSRRNGYTAIWIVEDWVAWKYYINKILDRWMHFLRGIPGARMLVDEIWETRYYPIFTFERHRSIPVSWDMVDKKWNLGTKRRN